MTPGRIAGAGTEATADGRHGATTAKPSGSLIQFLEDFGLDIK